MFLGDIWHVIYVLAKTENGWDEKSIGTSQNDVMTDQSHHIKKKP